MAISKELDINLLVQGDHMYLAISSCKGFLDSALISFVSEAQVKLVNLNLFEVSLDEVVKPEAFTVECVLDHEVGKLVDVAGGLQHSLGGQHRAVDFKHLKNK